MPEPSAGVKPRTHMGVRLTQGIRRGQIGRLTKWLRPTSRSMRASGVIHSLVSLLAAGVLASTLLFSGCSTTENSTATPAPPPPLTDAQQAILQGQFATFVKQLETDMGIRLVPIPAGTFMMGSPANELRNNSDSNETPQTRVTLTKNFFIGSTVVTQGQYEAVMGVNPSQNKKLDKNYPVENVSWDDAMDFCLKLTQRELPYGRLPEGYVFTLPTEAQWEYACRAGTTGPYAGDIDAMAWYAKNSGYTTTAVGKKKPNAWGLYDMEGNVLQWCLDRYGPYPGGEVTNPTGAGSGSSFVGRGGCFWYEAWDCRSAKRMHFDPDNGGNSVGFRIILYQAL